MVQIIIRVLSVLLLVAGFALPVSAQSVTPSPAMLEQFKQLPRAEQERLARQYGLDVNMLRQGGSRDDSLSEQEPELLQQPRMLQEQRNRRLEESKNEKTKKEDAPLERFGLSLFDAKISTFAPVNTMPVPESYTLGADDQLLIQYFGKQNTRETLNVSRDGTITLPETGLLQVGGLTFNQAKALIEARVKAGSIGTEAAVSMGKLRTINVFVTGEAKYPGSYAVSALTSVTQAMFVAGGVSDIGSLRDIRVNRGGKTIAQFDLYDLLLRGDSSNDVTLQHGDVVFIAPVTAIATVEGEVHRPALYELKKGETLDDLLNMAGGAKALAYPRAAVLERVNQQNLREIVNVDLTQQQNRQLSARAGDVLRLAATAPVAQNQIILAGAFTRPGFYAWQPQMRVTDLVKSLWSDLLPTADPEYLLILRQGNNNREYSVLQLDVSEAISSPMSAANVLLQPRDTLLVFHHGDNHHQRAKLNDYLRKQLEKKLEIDEDSRWLLGDVATRAFKELNERNTENRLLLNQSRPDALDLFKEKQQQMEKQEQLLLEEFEQLLSKVLTDREAVALSPHFSRTELLHPVLALLRQQARTNETLQIVSASGEVKVPGEYPLAVNATLLDLIKAAGGLKDSAFVNRAELSRVVAMSREENGIEVAHQALNLADAMTGGTDNITLAPRDRLNVFGIPNWQADRTIVLKGEVRFPGEYTIRHGELLSSVIERAGGLTSEAFAFGSVFIRKNLQEKEQAQYQKLIEQLRADIATRFLSVETGGTTAQDALLMIQELEKVIPVGRLVVNIDQIAARNTEFDLVVEDGDELFIPRQNRSVSVVGEVQHASSHRYDATLNVSDYLNLSGGFRKRADSDRIYVIRADGSVYIPKQSRWFSANREQLLPGDTIVAPVDTEYTKTLTTWTLITQIFYQSAVALAAINSF